MRRPYSAGSATSGLMTLLEEGHEGVTLNREELEKLACWIDLVVPYCGDYLEADAWAPFERARYDHFLNKRKKMQAVEARNIRQLVAAQKPKEAAHAEESSVDGAADGGSHRRRRQGHSPATVRGRPALAPSWWTCPGPLRPGDRIRVQGARHLAVQIDPQLGESLVHVPDGRLEWTVPAEVAQVRSGKTPYPPSAFQAERPRLTFRPVTLAELDRYRNLAANAYDLRGTVAAFPHATASSECRNDPVFAARNAIDGQRQNDRHGGWPVQSWGPEKTGPSWWQVDFGRVVEIDKVVIVLRADFPHDSFWHRATLVFSDGHRRTIDLEKKAEPQVFTFEVRRTSSLRLEDLVQDEPPGWCALTEVEAWGRDRIPVAEDLDTPAP